MADFLTEFTEMYSKIDTNDEGDITMKTVTEHIKAVEAGSGNNIWVNQRLKVLLDEEREVAHVELDEFLWIIEDIQEAGWSVKKSRENEKISDLDLRHIFDKVDRNHDQQVNRMVNGWTIFGNLLFFFFQEMRLACKYLCKQFNINFKRTQELQKYLLEFDSDNDGMLDFDEFKVAMKTAQKAIKDKEKQERDYYN
eukprot:TRINITY_DN50104_c0_g1_i1.p1 TRINITY_DN50104_c0_g1~~TRINITY_DN50104_c0_g1_i1.p1  ORF type:complete len:196 (-),score=57.81 TRINITY_DN50104_c0_g1_i1:42-629(-)